MLAGHSAWTPNGWGAADLYVRRERKSCCWGGSRMSDVSHGTFFLGPFTKPFEGDQMIDLNGLDHCPMGRWKCGGEYYARVLPNTGIRSSARALELGEARSTLHIYAYATRLRDTVSIHFTVTDDLVVKSLFKLRKMLAGLTFLQSMSWEQCTKTSSWIS